ncbi:MAG TPA: GNAT family N-acetyltransferase [Candidatus Dormibacteraeota bacterium]|nr:GNAT family N-acetyltransferase [Candidatus Dormibacteraeota bacterium]
MSTGAVRERIVFRLLEPSDERLIRCFFYRLSLDTIYRRFLSPVVPPADSLVRRLMNVDHCRREALVALDQRGIAGVARYAPFGKDGYEVAIVVADDRQGQGPGTILMRRLGHIARARGITSFHATIQAENRRALRFLQRLSPASSFRFVDGVIEAEVPIGVRGA